MAKRLPVFLLILVFCCVSVCAAAEETWTCPGCGQEGNTQNFCPACGSPRPGGSSAVPAFQSDAVISVPGLEDFPILDPALSLSVIRQALPT